MRIHRRVGSGVAAITGIYAGLRIHRDIAAMLAAEEGERRARESHRRAHDAILRPTRAESKKPPLADGTKSSYAHGS
jgi:hypothetical protein